MQTVDHLWAGAYRRPREARARTRESPHSSAPPPKSNPPDRGSGTESVFRRKPAGLSRSTTPGSAPTLSGPPDRLAYRSPRSAQGGEPTVTHLLHFLQAAHG